MQDVSRTSHSVELQWIPNTVGIWIPEIWITEPLPNKTPLFRSYFKWPIGCLTIYLNRRLFAWYSIHGLNTAPFGDQTATDNSNTGLVSYSDPHFKHFCLAGTFIFFISFPFGQWLINFAMACLHELDTVN